MSNRRQRHEGRIVSVKPEKGFGFIAYEGQDIFFHKKNTLGNFADYYEGDQVHFSLVPSRKNRDSFEAVKVISESNLRTRDHYLATLEKGQIIDARIRFKSKNGFHVGLSHCADGFLAFDNISYVKTEDRETFFQRGDEVKLKVTKVDLNKKLVYLNFKNIITEDFWENEDIDAGSVFNTTIHQKLMTQYGYSRFLIENEFIYNYEFSIRRKLGINYDELDRDEVYRFLAQVDDLFEVDSSLMVKVQETEPEIHKVVLSWWIENDYELERAENVLRLAYQQPVSDLLLSMVYTNLLDIAEGTFVDDLMKIKAKFDQEYPRVAEDQAAETEETAEATEE